MGTANHFSSPEIRRVDRPACLFGVATLILVLFRLAGPQHAAARPWALCDLSPPGATAGHAAAINDRGQVVGWWRQQGRDRAFLWSPEVPNGAVGTFVDLELPGMSRATGISAAGQVVGWTAGRDGRGHAFLWTPVLRGGTEGVAVQLQVPGAQSSATAINDAGQVTGYYTTRDDHYYGFLWSPAAPGARSGRVTRLGGAGDVDVLPNALNNGGQVAGRVSRSGVRAQSFLWCPEVANGAEGRFTVFRALGAGCSEATAINDEGQVAGYLLGPDGALHGYAGKPGVRGEAGTLVELSAGACFQARANGINDEGQVVGWSDMLHGGTCGTLFGAGRESTPGSRDTPRKPQELSPRDAMMSEASAINRAGQVVGTWQDSRGIDRAVLWQPAK